MGNHFIYDGVINDTQKRQWLEKWYEQVYFQEFGYEGLFNWEKVTDYNMVYRRKHNTVYGIGNIKSFNGITKKLNYSLMSYQEENILMDQTFTFARELSPIENKRVPMLLKTDIQQAVKAEIIQKRKKMLDTLQMTNATARLLQSMTDEDWDDQDKVLKFFDDFIEEAVRLNMNMTDILASSKVYRALKKHLKLNVISPKQVNIVIDGVGKNKFFANSMTTVEGYTIWYVAPAYEYNSPEGLTVDLVPLKNNVQMIGLESGSQQDWIKLRQEDHTPLRVAPAPVGIGKGNQIIVEWIKNYGAGITEPKKFLISVSTKKKKDLSDANSNYKIWLQNNSPADPSLEDFKALVIEQLSTNQAMWNIKLEDIDFFKQDGTTALTASDITIGVGMMPSLNIISIKAKDNSTYYTGTKTLNINVYDGN